MAAAEESRGIAEARRAVCKSDIERKAFFKQTYNVDLLNADLYDLTLNSDYLSLEAAATAIITAASDLPRPGAGKLQRESTTVM